MTSTKSPSNFLAATARGGVLLAILAVGTPAVRGDIIPPNGSYAGQTYNAWQVRWWQNLLSIPVVNGTHPFLEGGSFDGENGVLFLVANFSPTTIDLTISDTTALFFPIVNTECSVFEPPPYHGSDEPELRACANEFMDHTSDRFAVIDGVPVSNLDEFRFESPLFEWGPLPENNIFQFFGLDAPEGTTSLAVDAGYYLLLTPMSVGPHTIHIGATFELPGSGSIDTTYNINVVPEPASYMLLSVLGLLCCGWRRVLAMATSPGYDRPIDSRQLTSDIQ